MPLSAANFSATETLRNGTVVVVRAAHPDDRERIARAFAGLERGSIYTRYFSYKEALTDREFAQLDSMDFVRDVMLVVTTAAGPDEIVIASARYIAHDEADGSLTAEVAFTVEEDYQGNGIAGRLLAHLARIARDNGIARLEADVLADNKAMLGVFRKSGLAATERRDGGVLHIMLALTGG